MAHPWKTTVTPQTPFTRCYYCGSADLVAVCHECGVGICEEHRISLVDQPWYRSFPEFTDLNLERTPMGELAEHCSACFHYVHSFQIFLWAGVLVGFAGFFGALFLTWRNLGANLWGWVVVIIGLMLVAFALLLSILYGDPQMLRKLPHLPVLGRFPELAVREYVGGQIQLDAGGKYRSGVDRTYGRFDYTVRFAIPDQRRKRLYRHKYGDRTPPNLHFSAGFLVGKGSAALTFLGQAADQRRQANTVELSAPVSSNLFLTGFRPAPGDPSLDPRWQAHCDYEFDRNGNLPLQIVPALVAEGEKVGLELLVQMDAGLAGAIPDGDMRVVKLQLCTPRPLGDPRAWHPSAQLDPADATCGQAYRALVWKNVSFTSGPEEDAPLAPLHTPGPYARFYLRFDPRQDLRNYTVFGQLQVRLEKKLLSGLDGVSVHFPLGGHRHEINTTVFSDVSVGFRLNLRRLPVRFPLVRAATERTQNVPGHAIVARLVRLLNDADIYVKRVVENPPQTSRVSAHLTRRVWQIDGRGYVRIYPIDFQLVVTGLDAVAQLPKHAPEEMTFDLRVVGTVSTLAMSTEVNALRTQLVGIIRRL